MTERKNTHAISTQASRIGLGCVTFGREIDRHDAFKIMDYALENGITFFDTAAAYGAGASESIVGSWLASRRPYSERVVVATKILPPFDPDDMEKAVDESLRRLAIDVIDVLYLHRWDSSLACDDAVCTLDKLVKQGKVKMPGASNFTAKQIGDTVQHQKQKDLVSLRFAQNNHNLAISDVDDELKELCSAHAVSLITYSPLGAGYLTGKYQHGVQTRSRFDVVPGHKNIYFNEHAHRRLENLLAVAARLGCPAAHLALAWALHQPGIDGVLVGARSVTHIDQALSALDFHDAEIFAELESA